MGDIYPESGDTSVCPESQGSEEVFSDVGVIPVQVGLRRVEDVQVVLAVAYRSPGRVAKLSNPVCGRLVLVGADTWY